MHFNDLLADLAGEIGRVAALPRRSRSAPAEARRLAADLDFAAIKRNAERAAPMPPERAERVFVGGLASFFFKGTNGRWRDVLRSEELAMLEQAKARVMTPDCAAYMDAARPRRAPVKLRPISPPDDRTSYGDRRPLHHLGANTHTARAAVDGEAETTLTPAARPCRRADPPPPPLRYSAISASGS